MGDSTFPRWFFFNSLKSMNWPRKEGLKRRLFVETMVIDLVATNLGQYGRAHGSSDADLGARLIADAFRTRNWELYTPSELGEMLDQKRSAGWLQYRQLAPKLAWALLSMPEFEASLVTWFESEVWYGLMHPQEVMLSFDSELPGSKSRAKELASHGLHVDPVHVPGSSGELVVQAVAFVKAFEEETGPLPAIPPPLAAFIGEHRVSG
jgi:hypothetical protein